MSTTLIIRGLNGALRRTRFFGCVIAGVLAAESSQAVTNYFVYGAVPNKNWTATRNWSTSNAPSVNDTAYFINNGASTGAADNLLTNNFQISSLIYGQTNNIHNTVISPGVTLTISSVGSTNTNIVYALFAGTGTDAGAGQVVSNKITGTGGASLVIVHTNASISVRQTSATVGAHQSVLDLSGLDSLNATVKSVLVGAEGGSGA